MPAHFWLIIQGILITIGAGLIFTALIYIANNVFDQDKINRALMVNKKHKLGEFVIFKFSLYALIASFTVLMLLKWWNVPFDVYYSIKSGLFDGSNVYGIRIIPMRLIIALLVYSVIMMAWKYTLLYLRKIRKFDPEAEEQIVITSLLSYVVLAVAVFAALVVSGVDFTGLAIIAGALSVGVGFGLQNIVSNFVSGIIILLEKPIQPGDRVLIKGYEGFVKEISIRYTRIETLAKENVIIPNSDLMTSPIVNFVFEERVAKIKCHVGVAYNSDLDLVKQILLNVAAKHSEVLKDPIHQPSVYMNEFGENNLLFELQCVISDVNQRQKIISDLNFAIAKAFRESKVVMAHPQRDVYIKQEA